VWQGRFITKDLAMNDNVNPMTPHHAQCLVLLNDLHDLFAWADKMGIAINSDDPSLNYAMDFNFWRGELAKVLLVDPCATAGMLARAGVKA